MKTYLSICFLIIVGIAQAQSVEEKLTWKEGQLLTWEDFKGVPLEKSLFHANTNTGLSYSWGLKGTSEEMELSYKVECYFYPDQSWVQPASKNDVLLKHEQLHFDISELHARKLRKILANFDASKLNKDARDTLNSFYQKIDEERSLMQLKFDKESNHSLNKNEELKWQQYVQLELNKLAAYKD